IDHGSAKPPGSTQPVAVVPSITIPLVEVAGWPKSGKLAAAFSVTLDLELVTWRRAFRPVAAVSKLITGRPAIKALVTTRVSELLPVLLSPVRPVLPTMVYWPAVPKLAVAVKVWFAVAFGAKEPVQVSGVGVRFVPFRNRLTGTEVWVLVPKFLMVTVMAWVAVKPQPETGPVIAVMPTSFGFSENS